MVSMSCFVLPGRTSAQKDIKKAPVPFLDLSHSFAGKQTWVLTRPDQLKGSRLERCMLGRPDIHLAGSSSGRYSEKSVPTSFHLSNPKEEP